MNITDRARWTKWSIKQHPPMRSDNLNETMKLVRFMGNPYVFVPLVIGLGIIIIICTNVMINMISDLPAWINGSYAAKGMGAYIGFHHFAGGGTFKIYAVIFAIVIILCLLMMYKIRVSYAEKDLNKGQEGKARWTTLKEIDEQFKKVPLMPSRELADGSRQTNWFKGKPGNIVSRWRDNLYIDTQLSNNLYLGTTRSGKGELYVFATIDICSRAEQLEDRSTMIIFDPKVELYKSSKRKALENRGYEVRLLNFDDPDRSAGYDPLYIAVQHYKAGHEEKAQQAARTFSFGIFNSAQDAAGQEPIWKNTATDLFTALIIANITDCIEADEILNMNRRITLRKRQENYREFFSEDPELAEIADERWELYVKSLPEEMRERYDLMDEINCIPDSVEYKDIHPNERNINCYSVIKFFQDLCDRASLSAGGDNTKMEKEADSLLEDYFNSRPNLDYAKSLYATIKSAKERTKGSIYVNMQSAVSIFNMNSIARMTAENDIDFEKLGYGDKPMAIFLGIPSEDRSNYFIATTFVAQVYQYLVQLAKTRNGKLKRNVRFILDEFGNMPVIENFSGFLTVCLGVGMSFDLFVQSYGQIENKYGEETDTIKENCANRIYILNGGNESTDEFSQMLGNRTVIDVQRTGSRFDTSKTYMESTKEVPLMFPEELRALRQGETVMQRISKREDIAGASVKAYPIINEYASKLRLREKMKVYCSVFNKRIIKHDIAVIKDTGEPQTFSQEIRKKESDLLWWDGTALMYRYQYMSEDFPNPNDIDFDEVCDESRADIDFTARVNNPAETALKLKQRFSDKKIRGFETHLKDVYYYAKFYNFMANNYGEDFMDYLHISETDKVGDVIPELKKVKKVCGKEFSSQDRDRVITLLRLI